MISIMSRHRLQVNNGIASSYSLSLEVVKASRLVSMSDLFE